MNMRGKKLLLSAGILISCFAFTSVLKAQQSTPMVEDPIIKVRHRKPTRITGTVIKDDVIKANPRTPKEPSKYYLGTNIKRSKKIKTKIVMLRSFYDCPSYMHFNSKPKTRRERKLARHRKKLMAKR